MGNVYAQLGRALYGAGKDFGTYAMLAAKRGGTNAVLKGLGYAAGGAAVGGTVSMLGGHGFAKGAAIGAVGGLSYKTMLSAKKTGAWNFMQGNWAAGGAQHYARAKTFAGVPVMRAMNRLSDSQLRRVSSGMRWFSRNRDVIGEAVGFGATATAGYVSSREKGKSRLQSAMFGFGIAGGMYAGMGMYR